MNIHELIRESQNCIADTVCAEQNDELGSAYDCLDRLYDLLTEELVSMERPE